MCACVLVHVLEHVLEHESHLVALRLEDSTSPPPPPVSSSCSLLSGGTRGAGLNYGTEVGCDTMQDVVTPSPGRG